MTNSPESSDRNQVIYAQVVARAWQDEAYKSQLLANPKQTLAEAGVMTSPESADIYILEDTEVLHHLVLPQDKTFADFQDEIAGGLASLFPLSADQQILIRQVTENVKYFVLPRKPQMSEAEQNEVLAQAATGNPAAINTVVVVSTVQTNICNLVTSCAVVAIV